MQISFTTKEESKAAQQAAFLALSGGERIMSFVRLSKKIMAFQTSAPERGKDNFWIDFTKEKEK
ncbi:hypothetical protein ACLI09_09985 [Flavobacterium sp. RHBU_24]|uniref:hypothetical protein n=1 Tax=Flavobacterium sp. RHBU_24 TaxID=3391185 RepID=UPI0039851C58